MTDRVIAVASSDAGLRLIEDCLSRDSIEVVPASCLSEALRQQAASRVTVIVYDADTSDWRDALEKLLRIGPACRVVFLSRLAGSRLWLDMLDAGAYDLVMKPFRAVEISSVVRSAFDRVTSARA